MPSRRPCTAAAGDAGLNQRQQLIDRQRQQRGRDAAEDDKHPVLRLQAGENVVAETRLADRRGERRGADHPDSGRADAGHDHRQRQRQFDIAQQPPGPHADDARGFAQARIDAVEAGHGVAQDRQHRIERQRQHRRQEAERRKSFAEDALGQGALSASSKRVEQGQKREAGNGLHDAGDRQQGAAKKRPMSRGDGDRQADAEPNDERGQAHQHMAAEIVGQARPCVGETGVEDHAAMMACTAQRRNGPFRESGRSIPLVNIAKILPYRGRTLAMTV